MPARADPLDPSHVRLAELLAALSLGIDLGFGQPMEHVLRQCIISLRVGEQLGLDDDTRAAVYYTALLINVGCHSDAHEQAKWFGDDIEMKSGKYDWEPFTLKESVTMLRQIGAGQQPLHRFRTGLDFAIRGRHEVDGMIEQHANLARSLAAELGLPALVIEAVGASYERWDGRGWPGDMAGEAIPIASRITQLADFVEVAHRVDGVDAAVALATRRSGSQFDPAIAGCLADHAPEILSDLDHVQGWETVIASEPALTRVLSGSEFDEALRAIANFVDLKSPYTLGHSRAVAELTASAGGQNGQSEDDVRTLYRAGLVHGFGRLGVSNSIWDKRGPLGMGEWERVRMHPYLTERMLKQSQVLAPLGRIAVEQCERMDGSGYPRGLPGNAISRSARILGAASAYQAMLERRPHRDALGPERAASELRAGVQAGQYDGDAVEAVLAAAGHGTRRRREGPAGLTSREIEVLTLLAQGLSNKQIAQRLVISPKTAGNHVQNIYTKIDATNRAGASLFAMRNGLLPEQEYPIATTV